MRIAPLIVVLLLTSPIASARQDSDAGNGVIHSCMRDGVRYYTASKPLPTDSNCRRISYSTSDRKSAQSAPGTFKGYRCKSDCSGHRAGYAWAQGRGTSSYAGCTGNSQSFIEGCRSYIDEMNSRASR